MKKRIDWFASPLKKSDRFMAAFNTTHKKFDINASDTLYVILSFEDDFENESYKKNCMILNMTLDRAMSIRRFFLEIYENEEECIDILNKRITQRYYVKDIVIENSKSKHSNHEVNKRMKDALNTIFENLEL